MAKYKKLLIIEFTHMEKDCLTKDIKTRLFTGLQWDLWNSEISEFLNRKIEKFIQTLEGKNV